MSTRSFARNLFPPLDNTELAIRRRSHVDPTLLNNFEMVAEGNGDPPVPDLRTMEELCQPSLNGQGGPFAPIAIQATNFGLKNDMIQQVQNSCQFHELLGDDANKHLDKFLHVTQSIKVNGVTDDALRLYLFPHSLTHHATAWFDYLPRNSINTFEQMAKMFLGIYFPPSMVTKLKNEITNIRQCPDESLFEAWECYKVSIDRCPNHNMLPVTQIDTFYNRLTLRHRDTINAAGGTFMKRRLEKCYDLIENMTAHHDDWDTLAQLNESSSFITSSSDQEIVALKAEMAEINKNLMKVLQINQQVKAVTPSYETCGGPHPYSDCPATVGQTQNESRKQSWYSSGEQPRKKPIFQGASHGQNPPPAYQAPGYQALVHQPLIPQLQVVTTAEFTNYMKANDAILKNMQTNMTSLTNSNLVLKNMFGQFMKINTALSSGSRTLPMEREIEVTKDTVPLTNNGSTRDVQPPLVQIETLVPNSEPVVAPIIEPVVAPVSNYNDMTASRIDVIDMACEEYSQEVLGFFDVITSGNPTPYYDPIVSTSYLTLNPFGDSDFRLEEVDAFLALEDDATSPKVDHFYYDPEGDILLLEAFLNDDPSLSPPKGDDKLPVIIAKDLSTQEKDALINVLKSHKQAIAWQLSDIKDINLEFCTHKILMKDNFEPAVQHQEGLIQKSTISLKRRIPIDPKDQEKTTFTCPYGTFAYHRMPFGLFFRNSFGTCLSHLEKMLKRCEDTSLCLNWEKSHFMVKECIVLDHKISKNRIEVDKAKVDVIAKLPHSTTVKGICSFLSHAGFYRRFIQDFSKIARPMTRLLEKDTLFFFSIECIKAFQTLKRKLTQAPILVAPDWDFPFEFMCDATDFAIGAVLGQRKTKHLQLIHYASKTMTDAQAHYTTTEKELLFVVYAFEKFRPYLVLSKSIVYTDHSALKYLFNKQNAKPRLLR
nr:reverse transcriptase domain-containing protein [Tanacetum cinerariifolium]